MNDYTKAGILAIDDDAETIGQLTLNQFQTKLDAFTEIRNTKEVELMSAKGSKGSRSLRSTLHGALLVYFQGKGLEAEGYTLIWSGLQPFDALEAYYKLDCGEIYYSEND